MNPFSSFRAKLLAVLAATLCAAPALAQLKGMTGDGWRTWRVPARQSAPEICCFRWNRGNRSGRGCDLDGGHGGFSVDSDGDYASDELQIYARLEDGAVRELRALSSSCPVHADGEITDLGPLPAKASIDWIDEQVIAGGPVATDALTAIAFHDGDDAVAMLIGHGRRNADPELRSEAWFWLAQSAAAESETEITRAAREDDDDEVREDAIFALSQLPDERAVRALGDILEDRRIDMAVREQALFWLAQADSDQAFEYIDAILTDN
jgi:hypothetical protein